MAEVAIFLLISVLFLFYRKNKQTNKQTLVFSYLHAAQNIAYISHLLCS